MSRSLHVAWKLRVGSGMHSYILLEETLAIFSQLVQSQLELCSSYVQTCLVQPQRGPIAAPSSSWPPGPVVRQDAAVALSMDSEVLFPQSYMTVWSALLSCSLGSVYECLASKHQLFILSLNRRTGSLKLIMQA